MLLFRHSVTCTVFFISTVYMCGFLGQPSLSFDDRQVNPERGEPDNQPGPFRAVPPDQSYTIIDPQAKGDPHYVVMLHEGKVFYVMIYPLPDIPAPVPPVPDNPTPDNPAPILPDNPTPNGAPVTELGQTSQLLLYNMAETEHALAKAVRAGQIKTDVQAGNFAIKNRNNVGTRYGKLLNERIDLFKVIDSQGNITDIQKYAQIHDDLGTCMDAVLRPKPAYLQGR
jgi:hypothetical protein